MTGIPDDFEEKMKEGFPEGTFADKYDRHVFAYWRKYFPFVPPAYKKYEGQKQAC